jgi:hypothetical protein
MVRELGYKTDGGQPAKDSRNGHYNQQLRQGGTLLYDRCGAHAPARLQDPCRAGFKKGNKKGSFRMKMEDARLTEENF